MRRRAHWLCIENRYIHTKKVTEQYNEFSEIYFQIIVWLNHHNVPRQLFIWHGNENVDQEARNLPYIERKVAGTLKKQKRININDAFKQQTRRGEP